MTLAQRNSLTLLVEEIATDFRIRPMDITRQYGTSAPHHREARRVFVLVALAWPEITVETLCSFLLLHDRAVKTITRCAMTEYQRSQSTRRSVTRYLRATGIRIPA